MISDKEINEIRVHLEKAQNPIFFYDNDADGFCSYVLLRRNIGRGYGVAVRSYPGLDVNYARKAQELGADYVFVLDKPVLSKEFVSEINSLGLPLVWIDHHDVPGDDFKKDFKNIYVYNSAKKNGKEEPVTFICYEVSGRKEDSWIGIMGCIADHYLPGFSKEFEEEFGEFWKKGIEKPFDAYYETEIGELAQMINFGLKDSISNVVKLQNFVIGAKGPMDLQETRSHSFRKKYIELKKKYDALLDKVNVGSGKLIFFTYGGDLSISSELAGRLSHLYPVKYIAVGYKNGGVVNLSIRGKNIKGILERVLREFEDATGGGHEDAVGSRIKIGDLDRFKEVLDREIGNNS